MIAIELKAYQDTFVNLCSQLKVLQLTQSQKKKYALALGREIARQARERCKTQTDIEGHSWEPRKSGKGRMLRKIARSENLKVFTNEAGAVVTWSNTLVGQIARRMQEGITETMTAAEMKKRDKSNPDAPCTRIQARAMQQAGFKLRSKGGGQKRVSIKWILENMTQAQAGAIIRSLRDEESKQQWNIPLAARSFLGANSEDKQKMAQQILDMMLNNLNKR